MSEKFCIKGGNPLKGEVKIGGAKNSVLKLMAAAILVPGPVKIYNVPELTDVEIMLEVIRQMGIKTDYREIRACKQNESIIYCSRCACFTL